MATAASSTPKNSETPDISLRDSLLTQLQSMRDGGTYKQERVITSAQGASVGECDRMFWYRRQFTSVLYNVIHSVRGAQGVEAPYQSPI